MQIPSMTPKKLQFILRLLLSLTFVINAAEAGPKVIASIKPIHSLIAGVMEEIGEPMLLIKGGASPHDYSLRPSDVRNLNNAQAVFWIGNTLETFLVKPLANTGEVRSVALLETPNLTLLTLREGGTWQAHAHLHEHEDHAHALTAQLHDQSHVHPIDYDPHIWLNPQNAIAMVRQIGAVLSEVDPAHKAVYQKNATALIKRLKTLDQNLAATLDPVKDQPYIVFHDAYQYFERHYGLAAAGSLTVNPEQKPGAKRIREIRRRIIDTHIRCVFSEPQFQPALVRVLIEHTPAKSEVLDPLGADLEEGTDAYFQLLNRLSNSLSGCLKEGG